MLLVSVHCETHVDDNTNVVSRNKLNIGISYVIFIQVKHAKKPNKSQ